MNNNTIKYLYDKKYKSITKNVKFTVWSNIQCDYIFVKNIKNTRYQILYTKNSDHLPIILDI